MYGGELVEVTLLCKNESAGVIIDRFGTDVLLTPKNGTHFTARVQVSASKQFFGWIFGLGEGIEIIEPESVVNEMKKQVQRLADQFLKQ